MSIKLGNVDIQNIYLGNNPIQGIYLGNQEIWEPPVEENELQQEENE